jgi:hypothetical protein
MKSLWPDGDDLEVSMREVFDEAADDDQPIKDRYGLVSYGPGMIAQMAHLPSLGVMSDASGDLGAAGRQPSRVLQAIQGGSAA